MSKQQYATAPPAYQQPQYNQPQYAQPIQAIAVPQVQMAVPAPAGAPVLDFRSPQEQADAARKGPKSDIDQYAWCLLSLCVFPIPVCCYVWCCGDGRTGYERPCGERGCDPDRCCDC
ncbi:hypothetical protein TrLO_g4580 [Triparma laevis f. longispina]|uniref:Uncharacterized protein n=1 Tax=Triparma laevis f. longispina TaxID=1714387 RepID=A0A9W7L141_9STRA|nr:hypothetical protein TrLO_g4580 [Triparma laevis f. longispina]